MIFLTNTKAACALVAAMLIQKPNDILLPGLPLLWRGDGGEV
jgi:hypothetical protein